MAELGVGYVSIIPEVSRITPEISKALGQAEPAVEQSGRSMGSRISSGIGTALKASVAGVGVAAGGALAGAITKGMGRLTGIENAQASLRGLGHDARSVSTIMDDALASVRGTAFGLETAATVAASAVAAGISPGEDLQRTLTMVGDAATIAGVDMESMGSIVNKVATSDMMQMDVANQLMDAGIPILQMVAEEMGVTAEEARELASDGKISFEIFQNALEEGVGGAALEAGDTFQGAFANMGAALGRLGATGLRPFFDLSKDAFGAATDGIDALEARLAPLADNVASWLQGTAVPAVRDFWESLQGLGQNTEIQAALSGTQSAVSQLVATGRSLAPVVVNIASALGEAGAALGITAWSTFVSMLEVAGSTLEAVAGPLESVTGFLAEHPNLVAAGIAAWTAFKTVPGIVDRVGSSVSSVTTALSPAAENTRLFGSSLGEAYGYARQANPEMGRLGAAFQVVAGQGGVASAAMGGLARAGSGIVSLFGGPWGVALAAAGAAIGVVSQANQKAEAAQDAMAESAREAASAQHELQAAVAGTSGTLNEQAVAAGASVIKGELAELIEMGEAYSGWLRQVDTDTNVWERMFNIGGEWEADKARAQEIRDTYEALSTTVEGLGLDMGDLSTIVAEGGPEYEALIVSLRGSGEAGMAAADQLQDARGEMMQMVQDARRLDPAVAEAAAAIDLLADSSSTADEKLSGLQRMLQAMGLAPKDAEMAMRDAAESVDEIVEAATSTEVPLENMGSGLMEAARAGDWTHEGWQDLSRTLQGMGEELQNVATNGGDVAGTYEMQQAALDALATQYGLTRQEVDELGRMMGLVPDEIIIGMSLEGADETTQRLAEVWTQMRQVPAGQAIEISALTDEAAAALESIGIKVEEVPGSTNVTVTAEDEQAQKTLDAVMQQLGELEGFTVEASVLLNATQLEGSARHAQDILDALDVQEPTPQAQIIIDQLLSGVDISQGQLDFLASQSPTPIADLEKALLESGVTVSNEMLDALATRPTTPVVDADNEPLKAGVSESQRELDKLKDKTVTITTQHRAEYFSVHMNDAARAAGVNPANIQGPFPTFESGGRLPTSGPGTHTVDGILGVDGRGIPVARVNAGEWVINRPASETFDPLLHGINSGDPRARAALEVYDSLPALAGGGVVPSITSLVQRHFPEMTITSTHRPGDSGYHGRNMAVDFSNGTDVTPEMARAAEWFHKNYGNQLAQLIHWGPWNIGAGQPVGDGMGFYGAGTMQGHRNHVHLAADAPLSGSPSGAPSGEVGEAMDTGGSWAVTPATMGSMTAQTSRSMSWSAAPKVEADFGTAGDFHSMASRYVGARDHQGVELGVTSTSTSYTTSPGAYPVISGTPGASGSGSGGGGGWGHDFFVHEIARNARDKGLPERGAMIGVGTAFVESGNPLKMYANRAVPESLNFRHDAIGSDHDSVGLFQQRDNGAWGTVAQRMNPYESAGLFYNAMLRKFPNWEQMNPGAVAQGVQVSAFPDRYATQMEAALQAVRNVGIYDSGGWLMPGQFGFNASRDPEPVFNAAQWGTLGDAVMQVPPLVQSIHRLVPALEGVASATPSDVRGGATAGHVSTITEMTRAHTRWFDQAQIVIDAEEGLAQTRAQAAQDVKTLEEAERAHAEALDNLAHVQSQEATLSTSMQRRLADAEKDLADARGVTVEETTAQTRKIADAETALQEARADAAEADADKQADAAEKVRDAEEKLARAREDVAEATEKSTRDRAEKIADAELKLARLQEDAAEELAKNAEANSEAAQKAADDVAKAEEELAKARENAEGSLGRIEAAERTVAAARIQAAADLVSGVTEALSGMAASVATFASDMSRLAQMAEATSQAVGAEQQAMIRHNIEVIRAQNAYRLAEWDVVMARQEGLDQVTRAEERLSGTRQTATKIGSTSVTALSQAVDRFRVNGVFAADMWTVSSGNMAAATAGYTARAEETLIAHEERKAAAQAELHLREMEALHRQEMAGYAVAEANLAQVQSAHLLQLHTAHLAEQTAALYGMSSQNASGLGRFAQGLSNLFGGGGGIISGVLTGLAGFAAGGPLGAIPGALMALQALPTAVSGVADMWNNRHEARAGWGEMDTSAKLGLGLGVVGAGASTALGVYGSTQGYGPDAALGGIQIGQGILDATLGSMSAISESRMVAAEARYEAQVAAAQAAADAAGADLALEQAETSALWEITKAHAAADVDWHDLQVQIAEATDEAHKAALEERAELVAQQRDDYAALIEETKSSLKRDQAPMEVTLTGDAFSADQVKDLIEREIAGRYDLDLRVTRIEQAQAPTAADYAAARR